MSKIIKTVSFSEMDSSLVKRIGKYQKSKGLNSFIAAVRELCDAALILKEITKWERRVYYEKFCKID